MRGFTLVELLVVMATVLLLIGFSVPFYISYRHKALASSYIMPLVRACLVEAEVECSQGSRATDISDPINRVPSCRSPVGTPYGDVILSVVEPLSCDLSVGRLSKGVVIGKVNGFSYKVLCLAGSGMHIACRLEAKND